MQDIKVTVHGDPIPDEEVQMYIKRGRLNPPHNELIGIIITIDGDYADIDYKYARPLVPQRFAISGDMLIEDFNSMNDAKQAEYLDKIPNSI